MPKRPEQPHPSLSGPQFARPPSKSRAESEVHTQTLGGRATRPFRFGSEDRPDPDPALGPGDLVGERYRVVQLLGEGGMGRVYEAEHTVLQRRVALKLLRRDSQSEAENLARFQQEALAASRIGTPEIVEVVDFASHVGPAGVQTYMVMELLVGESLEDWMDGPGRLGVGVELLAQLCDGLAAAHRAGVIHRDIKPANVFCQAPPPELVEFESGAGPGAGARIKILDFGIAKIAGAEGYQTRQGSILGTPYYLAPERVMGAELTPAADVYSVGVILYEMLTGNVPFVADSFMGILARHVHGEPLDPRQAAPDRAIPDGIAALCMRLLAKEPTARPRADALAEELRVMLASDAAALAAVVTGPRGTAGAGADTQILADVDGASTSISARPTAVPVMDSFARPEARGGSSSSQDTVALEVGVDVGVGAGAPKRGLGVGLIAGLALLGLGAAGLWFAVGSNGEGDAAQPTQVGEGVGADSQADATPEVEATPNNPVEPGPDSAAPPDAPKLDPDPEANPAKPDLEAEPKPSAAEPTPSAAEPTPKKPRPEPSPASPADPKPKPKPEPAPDPSPADPPDGPVSGPPATNPDPELPTIKDDVYD